MSRSLADISSGGSPSTSATTAMSAISAGAACSRPSSWWRIAQPASRSIPALKLNQKIKAAAFAGGLACYPAGGSVDGRSGDHVLLAPPYISTQDDIDMIVERLGVAVDQALQSIND